MASSPCASLSDAEIYRTNLRRSMRLQHDDSDRDGSFRFHKAAHLASKSSTGKPRLTHPTSNQRTTYGIWMRRLSSHCPQLVQEALWDAPESFDLYHPERPAKVPMHAGLEFRYAELQMTSMSKEVRQAE